VFDAVVIRPGRNETFDLNKRELRQTQAVLRIYDSNSLWAVDVKRRVAAFDLVWLDNNKKVVHIVKHASRDSKPDTTFQPVEQARYVLEFADGIVDSKAMRIGGTAYFDESLLEKKS
jgi:uncharacterized membrane protein (UPF0127 family)